MRRDSGSGFESGSRLVAVDLLGVSARPLLAGGLAVGATILLRHARQSGEGNDFADTTTGLEHVSYTISAMGTVSVTLWRLVHLTGFIRR